MRGRSGLTHFPPCAGVGKYGCGVSSAISTPRIGETFALAQAWIKLTAPATVSRSVNASAV